MNREEMIKRAAKAEHEVDGHRLACMRGECRPGREDLEKVRAVFDAVLPQVTTVAELEALPKGVKLLGADGSTWQRNYTGAWLSDNNLTRRPERLLTLKQANPLTVVWQPS